MYGSECYSRLRIRVRLRTRTRLIIRSKHSRYSWISISKLTCINQNAQGILVIKNIKHARAGIPFEVMGLLIGEIIDDYTIKVVDVFSMP